MRHWLESLVREHASKIALEFLALISYHVAEYKAHPRCMFIKVYKLSLG
jgi:hypothetical protein